MQCIMRHPFFIAYDYETDENPDWMFLIYPTLAGVLVLLLIALCYLKLTRRISNRYAPVK